jgi:DNA-directed RNA polymerase specialized sigma subunit
MKKCELDQEIATLESKLTNLKANILLQVESFENENYKNVIVMHYLNGETWSDIARKLYVVKRTVLRWNDAALEQIKVPA